MTFSLVATDGTAVGMAVSSSSPAVAARCLHLRPGVGGAGSQNITDPRLGGRLLDALAAGRAPADAMADLVESLPDAEFRQLTCCDLQGRTAHFSGKRTLGVHGAAAAPGAVAAGNLLAHEGVPQTMVDCFVASTGPLELRLVEALEQGLAAGGEAGPVRSAGLAVVREVAWPETDLRVDWHEEPVAELRRLVEQWLPMRDDYVTRALHPDTAPSYGVPGDE